MNRFFLLLALIAGSLSACTTATESNPPRTATEQLLISKAAERAAEQLSLNVPATSLAYVDNSNFEGTDSKYAIASIRAHLLKKGIHLTDDRKAADVIIETRSGALSIDKNNSLIGTPEFSVPIPLASAPLTVPQVALYANEEQKAIAKFAAVAYDARTGALIDSIEPHYGTSHNQKKTFLIIFNSAENDALPPEPK